MQFSVVLEGCWLYREMRLGGSILAFLKIGFDVELNGMGMGMV